VFESNLVSAQSWFCFFSSIFGCVKSQMRHLNRRQTSCIWLEGKNEQTMSLWWSFRYGCDNSILGVHRSRKI